MFRIFIIASLVVLVIGLAVVKMSIFADSSEISILFPLPSYLVNSSLVQSLDFWKPKEAKVLQGSIEKPEITARAAYAYDITTDKVLYDKNSRERHPVASLVKIATAIVALESEDPTRKIRVSEHAAAIGENSMGISSGEVYTLEELIYGLILASGNDAAEAIAQNIEGGSSKFVDEMNRKAEILGLVDTLFVNPSGLEENSSDKREYSTAYDLAILTKHALTLPLFAKIAQTVEYTIPQTPAHKQIYLYNQTNLLTSYLGVKGVKTGYTSSAGLCLVTYAENSGHKLIGVILNSERRREEMRDLLDYSFTILGVKVPVRAN